MWGRVLKKKKLKASKLKSGKIISAHRFIGYYTQSQNLLELMNKFNKVAGLKKNHVCSITKSYLTLCDPTGCSSVHWVSLARILEWAAISFSRYLPKPRIEPMSPMPPALADRFFTTGLPQHTTNTSCVSIH